MANGMGALYVGHSGLRSSQDAINTVANNLANVNTLGYVRQQVVFRDAHYNNLAYSMNGNKKLTGLGTSIGELVHARDIFLDKAFRAENGRHAYYATTFEAVDEVQNYFQELEGTAFQEILTGETSLWQSFQELAKDPSDMVNQNLVIQKASLFASRAQAVMKGLINYQNNINMQISEDIGVINDYSKEIYELNNRIQAIEASGRETAMNERDRRDYLLDQLSTYGHITYNEAVDGTVAVKFEGVLLVDEMFCNQIGMRTDRMTGYITPYWPHLSNEPAGNYVEVLDFTREICTEFDTDIGELKALVQARGTTISNYTDILFMDPDAYDASVGLSIMQNTQAEFDQLVHGIVSKINDLLAPNKKMDLKVENEDGSYTVYRNIQVLDEENCCVGADGKKPPQELFTRSGCERYKKVVGTDMETGEEKEYYIYNIEDDASYTTKYNKKGITYNVFDWEEGASETTYYQKMDAAGNPEVDANGDPVYESGGSKPYQPWNKEGNEKFVWNESIQQFVLNNNYAYDTSKQYTTSEIEINYNLKKQVTNLPYINNQQQIDYGLANKLALLWEDPSLTINPRYPTKYTFGDYYKEMVGEIGIIGEMYESTADSLDGAVAAVENQRAGVIGVSSDEELTNMIKYQNAYNAASRYIQTVSDMIELLVSGL